MLGNEAVARGLYEAGCRLVSSYPGTPSTEITEYAAKYDEIYAEWAVNEKVALETAMGASMAGGRSFAAMKHVGLNVAADPLFVGAYVGVGGGFVIGVADDPGMHSSQNEQDSRHYAEAAKLPMLEPADSSECKEFCKAAFDLSEKYNTPVLLRLSTRISHSQSAVEECERVERELVPYVKNPQKHVTIPAHSRALHVEVEDHLTAISEYAYDGPFNRIERGTDNKIGIIAAGTTYNYAREVFGDSVSYLKLGLVYPLSAKLIREFAESVERVIVIEELDPVIETFCKSIGVECDGKNLLPLCGEFSQKLIREKLLGETADVDAFDEPVPARPPVLCPGCPHRGVFYVLKKLKLYVSGDIGCYTLGAAQPLGAMDTTFCMGASVSSLHGYNKILGNEGEKKSVAIIGDSTFMHSGITGLLNIVYNKSNSTVIIVDNSITGMTGHQQNPCSGYTLKGEPVTGIVLENMCAGVGVAPEHIRIVDPADIKEFERVLKEELDAECPSVVIARRPCALLKYVKHDAPYTVDATKCIGCRACMGIGCPCISIVNGKAVIDASLCNGCGLCSGLCRFNAISGGNNK